jgi:hypothetical protein
VAHSGGAGHTVGHAERATQNRVIALFRDELAYRYLGEWSDRDGNSNIEEGLVSSWQSAVGISNHAGMDGCSIASSCFGWPLRATHATRYGRVADSGGVRTSQIGSVGDVGGRLQRSKYTRNRAAAATGSSGITLVWPATVMKFVSPAQRGTTWRWMWSSTPAPAARPRFIPTFIPSGP